MDGIRPARDDGKSLLKWIKWRSRKRQKYKKKLKKQHFLDALYHHWLQTEVQDVHLYMSDSQVGVSNGAQYGLQTEDENRHLYTSDSQLHASYDAQYRRRSAKTTVRVIDAVYFCEEVVRNRVSYHLLAG
jgi:hypothetical protein